MAAVANGQPVAVSNGEFHVPAAVVQALGRDFFDELVRNYLQPTGKPIGLMPTSAAPIPLQNGDDIVPADVVAALGVQRLGNAVIAIAYIARCLLINILYLPYFSLRLESKTSTWIALGLDC